MADRPIEEPPTEGELALLMAYHSGIIAGMGEARNWLAAIFKRDLSARVAWRLADYLFTDSRKILADAKAPRNHWVREQIEKIERRVAWNDKIVDLNHFQRMHTQHQKKNMGSHGG